VGVGVRVRVRVKGVRIIQNVHIYENAHN